MRFGPIDLEEAEGALLAHSLRLDRLAYKKGRRLSANDLAALRAAGVTVVTAAKLDADDVDEDAAARLIATAVTGDHVTAAAPFTGRVNLFAMRPGLAVLDVAGVDRLNRIDEAITIATVPAFAHVEAKQMVATVKTIPFAVRRALVEQCLKAAHATPLIRVAPYRALDVAMIQTRLPGTKEAVLDKTVATTAKRIAASGGRLISESRCPHEVAALAERIRTTTADLLLIAGASAIADRRDVLPAAIEAAGGVVDHFGMPVDPGNLLLLAHVAARPILGLPGCARSPKLNGFDWVLQRLAAGIPVTRDDIMAMGVGGLLMEIPSRPQPRAATGPEQPGRVAAIVLAAGQSRRMGSDNKLLALVDGRPMVVHAVEAMRASKADPVIVVTGHEAARIRASLDEASLRLVHNPDYADGLSTSLKVGLDALPDDVAGVLIGLGDMPRIRSAQIDRLIAAFNPFEGRAICVPTVHGKRGNPVLFATRFVAEMRQIGGDVGARHLIGAHADEVFEIEMDDDAPLLDIDTPDALAALAEVEA